ncbi:ankyrin repeat domain-containing protein [Maribacter sp.]|nr:ankyrin repeat domain-containing protein [Maribacter sp.]
MKTPKINSFKMAVNLSLLLIMLTSSCAQSTKNSENKLDNTSKAKAVVDKPTINIHMAVLSGNLDVVRQHIATGSDINGKDAMSGATPLISAASFGKKDIAKALIDAGADLTAKNSDGATALHTAAFFCNVEIVQLLIDVKADKTAKNNFGMTPRESVMGPFAEIKPIYEMLGQQLGPIGLELDLTEIEKTRPVIAMMLQ